jgi:hypothetical protein
VTEPARVTEHPAGFNASCFLLTAIPNANYDRNAKLHVTAEPCGRQE